MPELQLISIECKSSEDITGDDSPYLKVDGIKVWGTQSMDEDDGPVNLESITPIAFGKKRKLRVELFDEDIGPDDLLGRKDISARDAGKGALEAYFTEDNADYVLTYEVLES